MNLRQCIFTENDCYHTGRTIVPKGVMVHSTGANNPNLRRYVGPDDGLLGENRNGNDWNHPGVDKCVHAFIGRLADGSVAVYQTLPWNWRGWHAGTGTSGKSANNTHISFEICEDGLDDPDYFAAVYRAAVELTAYLCREYSLDPLEDGVVICHHEGYGRGSASGHADVEHWFPKFGKTMDDYRADVAAELEENEVARYKYLADIPDQWNWRNIIRLLMDIGALSGDGSDPVGNGDVIDLSQDMVRMFVIDYKAGAYDTKIRAAGIDPEMYR